LVAASTSLFISVLLLSLSIDVNSHANSFYKKAVYIVPLDRTKINVTSATIFRKPHTNSGYIEVETNIGDWRFTTDDFNGAFQCLVGRKEMEKPVPGKTY
jgi:hypothetical protein